MACSGHEQYQEVAPKIVLAQDKGLECYCVLQQHSTVQQKTAIGITVEILITSDGGLNTHADEFDAVAI